MQPPGSDEQLVVAARRGSAEAVSALFARHWAEACRTARAVCRDQSAAEDVAQDALVRAFERLHTFDADRRFDAWLRRIVVNTALNARRAHRPAGPLNDQLPAPEAPEGHGLRTAVNALRDDRRTVVVLRYGLDLTPAEIAAALDVPVGTVHSRLARALHDLRTALEVAG